MEENMKEVFSAGKMYKISIIQQMLADAKIESMVINQKGSALLLGDIHLYVNEKDEEKAIEIVKSHEI